MHEDLRRIHRCLEYITEEIESTISLASDVFYLIEQGVDAHTELDPETLTVDECRAREQTQVMHKLQFQKLEIQKLEFPLFNIGNGQQVKGRILFEVPIPNVVNFPHFILNENTNTGVAFKDQSEIELIQPLFIWNNQESNSFNSLHLDQSGSDLIQYLFPLEQSGIYFIHYLFLWINQEMISSNFSSSATIKNLSVLISSLLDQSRIEFIQSFFSSG
ncbi:hypothetical protein CEXT_245861 [Caerostris extrusa]|uniref:Uncharacterized protein n=1 Tax=Caerostris extrusa TaxID=172846 RepID=A0AAV4MCY6_CAEEX|nr:hypothetical protein CEXT_245861 [Caerostris extrusa]